MTAVSVQFSDSNETEIVACFAGPQDPAAYPNQTSIDSSDARYATFFSALPVSVQKGLLAPTMAASSS